MAQITEIDIENFGSYKKFTLTKELDFKKVNVIYGRNYSGKTTLSRIFRTLETKQLPTNVNVPKFKISGVGGISVNQAEISNHQFYDVRVYNSDFVSEHLSFPDKKEGEIASFVILGDENNNIKNRIANIERDLGSEEQQLGLRYEQKQMEVNKTNVKTDFDKKEKLLGSKLTDHASVIKNTKEFYKVNYNKNSLQADIDEVKNKEDCYRLTEDEIANKNLLLDQKPLQNISRMNIINFTRFVDITQNINELLTRTITLTNPINELLTDKILQMWVKNGIEHHKGKRDACGFCGQTLPNDIWQKLDAHFNQESKALDDDLKNELLNVNQELAKIPSIQLTDNQFYSEQQIDFNSDKKNFEGALKLYAQDLEQLKSALKARQENLFKPVDFPELAHDKDAINAIINKINGLIDKNNQRTLTLTEDQEKTRTNLRLSNVTKFISDIDYDAKIAEIMALRRKLDETAEALKKIEQDIFDLERKLNSLNRQLKDEKNGAIRINEFLKAAFGHDAIQFDIKDNADKTANVKFEILRQGKPAHYLSDGERSLIAFCYFVAKLDAADTKDKPLIIYIDDPISSLDSNHIFFVFSLIETLIAKPLTDKDKEGQLFISTHNLDFLKYLKRVSANKIKGDKEKKDIAHFLIEKNHVSSQIVKMPKYLTKYITEFNYLFEQIYKCSKLKNNELSNADPFLGYSFGNNLRKFLETFLFFKYPNNLDQDKKIEQFFGSDQYQRIANTVIIRLTNELSHLEESAERALRPIDFAEIPRLATFILDKIKESDGNQYNALLKSIGVSET